MAKKQLTIVMGVLGALLLGGLYYLYTQIGTAGDMWPAEGEPNNLTFDINKLQKEISALREEVNKIPSAKERLEVLRVEYDLATRVLPRESNPDQLIAAIRTKATQANVIPLSLVPRVGGGARVKGRARAAFQEWSFSLSIRGSYDQIGAFVNRMEEFESNDPSRVGSEKRFFEVRDIEIVSEGNGMAGLGGQNPALGHTCNLVMLTYRYTGEQ